jgi:hypothetical protein
MSGRSSVESDLAREFRTQNAAVPWAAIALPEIRFASQNLLKAGLRKAVQVEIFAIWGDLRIEPRVKIVNPLASSGAGEFVDFPGIQTSVEMAVPGGQLVGSHLPDVAKAMSGRVLADEGRRSLARRRRGDRIYGKIVSSGQFDQR